MRNLLYILIVIVIMQSCKTVELGSTTVDSIFTERIVTVHDTTIKIEADSSIYQALIECDSNGRAWLKEIETLQLGQRSHLTNLTITPRSIDNLLEFVCVCDSIAIYQAMYKIYETTKETKSKVETIPVEVNKLTWWQQTQIYGFRALGSLLLIVIILKYIKTWLNPKSLIR